jgi:hypothetical protein
MKIMMNELFNKFTTFIISIFIIKKNNTEAFKTLEKIDI